MVVYKRLTIEKELYKDNREPSDTNAAEIYNTYRRAIEKSWSGQ